MTRERIRILLEDLQRELASAEGIDPETRGELHALIESLQIRARADSTENDERLTRRLEEQVHRFEASHPGVARVIANLIDTLALYGL